MKRLALWTAPLWVLGSVTLSGCGETNCQSTCRRIFDGAQCGVQIAGKLTEDSISDCITECKSALNKVGPMGDYNPYNIRNPQENYELENEVQAAAWMECVNSVTCDELDPATGRCAPTTF